MDISVLPSKLLTDLNLAADLIRGHDYIHIYSHFDTDGLTAASIVAKALYREGKQFTVTVFPTLTESQMQIIEGTPSECVLVTDLGASYISRFDAMTCDIVVLDHHTIKDQAKRICYANPHLYGIDGMTSGCGASMAFLFAITLNEKNWDLSALAMTGIVGDRQHINGLTGLNTFIFENASKKGFVKAQPGSLIPIGNLSTEILMCANPYIIGVSGNPDGVEKLLCDARITSNKTYSDLTPEECARLSSLICLKLLGQKVTKDKIEECVKPRYFLTEWGTDAETLSSLLNACGRQDQAATGIAMGLGDATALEEAKRIDSESRQKIMNSVTTLVNNNKIIQLEHIQWFDTSDSGFTGILCGIIMSYIGDPNKPTIGINSSEDTAKISSRGTFPLIDRGLDLASAMTKGCAAVGGEGGGHRIAAGGSFASERRDEFLNVLDKIIGEQLTAGN